ncbi:MAG: glycine cleavage system transcriptional repressor [Abditibacteriota bacterium]|nr:glycine cleavage system transcriptional repressor [Abditibacteriota bacterium]
MFIITAVGPDRPGMAHAVATVLSDGGYNIEDTTMTRLSGEFAMILIVSAPVGQGTDIEELQQLLAPLEASHTLFISCRAFAPETQGEPSAAERYILSVYGPENRGLVARITGVLAAGGVNISDVQTRVASSGAMYIMLYELEVPPTIDPAALSRDVEAAAQEIGAQISLRPLEENTL